MHHSYANCIRYKISIIIIWWRGVHCCIYNICITSTSSVHLWQTILLDILFNKLLCYLIHMHVGLCINACVRASSSSQCCIFYMFVNGGWKLHYIYNDSQLTDWLRLCCCARRRRTLKKWRWAWNRIKVQTRHDGAAATAQKRVYILYRKTYV